MGSKVRHDMYLKDGWDTDIQRMFLDLAISDCKHNDALKADAKAAIKEYLGSNEFMIKSKLDKDIKSISIKDLINLLSGLVAGIYEFLIELITEKSEGIIKAQRLAQDEFTPVNIYRAFDSNEDDDDDEDFDDGFDDYDDDRYDDDEDDDYWDDDDRYDDDYYDDEL